MQRITRTIATSFSVALAAVALAPSALADHHGGKKEAAAVQPAPELLAAIADPRRSEADRARDQFRNPAATLTFFGVTPDKTVVEIWPGGGWYTQILGPYLADKGKLVLAPPARGIANSEKLLASDPARFGKVTIGSFPAKFGGPGIAPGSADVVLTFRNVHNFRMGSFSPDNSDFSAEAFAEMFAMLKSGGVLGIVDHRLPESADAAREKSSGYIKVSTVRALAEAAGFRFAGSSEINANPKDDTDHPNGVWTLRPSLRAPEGEKDAYAAIGESDRMTLKFVKP